MRRVLKRIWQGARRALPSVFSPSKLLNISTLMTVLGVVLVACGAYGLVRQKAATTGTVVIHEAPEEVVTHSVDEPSEKPIDSKSDYRVPADKPRRLMISRAGITGFIQQVGVDQHGAVAVPNNVYLAGWYTGSALPGDSGLSIIDGHVNGRYGPAVFTDLHQLEKGDEIQIEFGDMSVRRFSVFATKQVPLSEASSTMLYQEPGVDRQLNLITCGGIFDRTTDSYPDRLIVMSKAL